MAARTHRTARADNATGAARPARHARRRTVAAASGLAALALVLGACGEEGTAEDAVGDATSAVGSAAAEATSAVGDATDDNGSGDEGATTGEQPAPEDGGENEGDAQNPDEQFLDEIRTVGVDAEDEQGYLTRGRDACASLDGDMGYIDVIRQYNDTHTEAPATEAPVVVAAAVRAFCPQHLPQIGQDEGGDQGGQG